MIIMPLILLAILRPPVMLLVLGHAAAKSPEPAIKANPKSRNGSL
jgi:hypothetical protein